MRTITSLLTPSNGGTVEESCRRGEIDLFSFKNSVKRYTNLKNTTCNPQSKSKCKEWYETL